MKILNSNTSALIDETKKIKLQLLNSKSQSVAIIKKGNKNKKQIPTRFLKLLHKVPRRRHEDSQRG